MEEQKIIQLYNLVLNIKFLSYDNLLSVGFSEKEIHEFMDMGIISLDKTNIKFNDIEGMYNHGKNLLNKGHTLAAYKTFKYCGSFPKEFKHKCFEMLVYSLKRKNMFLANKNFEMFCEMEPKISLQDKNLYLYLIGYVGDLSEEHKNMLRNMTFEDVELTNYKSELMHDENPIRELIFEDNLVLAINKLKRADNIHNREYIISLLAQAIKAEYEIEDRILALIMERNYEEVRKILLDIKSKRYLKTRQIYILIIVEAILKLQNNEEIIETECEKNDDFYLLLRSNNFTQALNLLSFRLTEKNIDRENDAVYLLLLDINDMMFQKSEDDLSRTRTKNVND